MYSPEKVIVARAKENKDWKEGPVPTMFTNLYLIDVKSNVQKQLTSPGENKRDEDPQVIHQYLTWRRYTRNRMKGDVWVKDGLDGKEQKWISNVDYAPEFYAGKKDSTYQ